MSSKKRTLSLILSLAMVLTMMPAFAVNAFAKTDQAQKAGADYAPVLEASESTNEPVTYRYPVYNTDNVTTSGIKEWKTGSCSEYTLITSQTAITALNAGWYVVRGDVSINSQSGLGEKWVVTGDVHMILEDGCDLKVSGVTIYVHGEANRLTIYGASSDSTNPGKLTVSGRWHSAGIGGTEYSSGSGNNITINGGKIDASGSSYASGIGGGAYGNATDIVINDGYVTARGNYGGSAIGGGAWSGTSSNLVFNGGIVYAYGSGYNPALIGYGSSTNNIYISSDVTAIPTGINDAGYIIKHKQGEDATSNIPGYGNLEFFVHPHDWKDVAVTTAAVSAACSDESHRHVGLKTVQLSISAEDVVYDEKQHPAVLTGLDIWEKYGIETPVITYTGRDGTVCDATTEAPSDCGKYTATAAGHLSSSEGQKSYSISADFEIKKLSWDEKPEVTVASIPVGNYNADQYAPVNSAGITKDVEYFFNTTESNEDGTAWSEQEINKLSSGNYYVYAVFAETDNVEGCTTEPFAFSVRHEHQYSYEQISDNEIKAVCTAEPETCNAAKTVILKIEDAVYDGQPYEPEGITTLRYETANSATIRASYFVKGSESELGSAPTDVGSYTAVITLTSDSTDYTLTSDFDITSKSVVPPTAAAVTYTYNGKEQSYVLTDSKDKKFYRIQGTTGKRTEAGTQDVIVELADPANYIWETTGDNEPITFAEVFTIDKQKIVIPEESTATYEYDGGYQFYGYEDGKLNYYTFSPYNITGFYRIDAGTQDVVISLKDKDNTEWSDGSIDDITYKFTVKPLEIPKPGADPRGFYADGSQKTYYPFYQSGDDYICLEGYFYNTTNNKQTNAGTYKVSVSPIENLAWEGGSTSPLVFDFKINEPSAYASIYCLKEKATGDYVDGYVYGSYLYDDENTSNEYVSTHYTPYMYISPSNATYKLYYTTNPNRLDYSGDWNSLKYTQLRFSGEYMTYYIYAVVSAPGYKTYTTRPCPVYIYKANQNVTSARSVVSYVQETTRKNYGSARHPIYKTTTETVARTENKAIRARSFNSIVLAGAAIINDLKAGCSVVQWADLTSNQGAKYTSKDINTVRECYEVPSYLASAELSDELALAATDNETIIDSLIKETLPMEKIISDYKEGTVDDEFYLFGDEIGRSPDLIKGSRSTDTTLHGDPGYTDETYTVTFNSLINDENDNTTCTTQAVKAGELVIQPDNPTAAGLKFKGWYEVPYKENSATESAISPEKEGRLWDFENYYVTDDTTLYAVWETVSSESTSSGGGGGGGSSTNTTTAAVTTSAAVATEAAVKNNAADKFVDVASTDYFYDAVNWAVDKEVTSGTDETHFSPDADTTRAQMVTFLWRAAGCPEPSTTSCAFADVAAGSYYEKAVFWAVEKGITSGLTDTTFGPDEKVTRAQAVAFLWRYAGSPEASVDAEFADVAKNAYYYKAVQWAVSKGITTGVSKTSFEPDDVCTRAQVVTFLYRALGK